MTTAARPGKRWPSWIDDILAYGPIAELETEWKAAIGDAITEVLDLRQGATVITCACCGASQLAPASNQDDIPKEGA